MIVILLSDVDMALALEKRLKPVGVLRLMANDPKALETFYGQENEIRGMVVDADVAPVAAKAWLDILASLSKRLPIIVVSQERFRGTFLDFVTSLVSPTLDDIVSALETTGIILREGGFLPTETFPIYSSSVAAHVLKKSGSLSLLMINAKNFGAVGMEYGPEAYQKLQIYFEKLLFKIWGAPGSFRSKDKLCRYGASNNVYLILLEKSRSDLNMPPPGALERLADRIKVMLEKYLWEEVYKGSSKDLSFLQKMPQFSVGHATAIYNPFLPMEDSLEKLLEDSQKNAVIQQKRHNERYRELMQTLIGTEGLLYPNYQGVFYLKDLSLEKVSKLKNGQNLGEIKNYIYAFEALIRVDSEELKRFLGEDENFHVHTDFLNPQVLFEIAAMTKLTLELDQACFQKATFHFQGLPGFLMANILPRNFYFLDQIENIIAQNISVIFEVAENEAINNYSLIKKVKDNLGKEKKHSIAIDDFGKGYAGIDRILHLNPELIKLDRSLVHEIYKDPSKKAFVEGIVKAAKITNILTLAEGVELMEDMAVLKELDIDLIQGFLLHIPQKPQVILQQLISSP